MKIAAFIPCTRPKQLIDALHDLYAQSQPVQQVFVVDNGDYGSKLTDLKPLEWWLDTYKNLYIHDFGRNIGTNAVWNLGLQYKVDFIMFLPDDMRFDHYFVHKCIYTFNDPNVAVVSAKIIPWEEELPENKENAYRCGRTCGHGKAGVFMIRGSVANELPLIPPEYKIFYGDDWIDFHVRLRMKLIWTELRWSCARHKYGKGVSATLKKTVMREEKHHWYKFLEENNEGRLPIRQQG